MTIGLPPGTDKLYFSPVPFQHGSSEGLEYGHVAMMVLLGFDVSCNCLGQFYSAPLDDYVDVVILPSQETVADVAADHESPYSEPSGCSRNYSENRRFKESFCYCLAHILISAWSPSPGRFSSVRMGWPRHLYS